MYCHVKFFIKKKKKLLYYHVNVFEKSLNQIFFSLIIKFAYLIKQGQTQSKTHLLKTQIPNTRMAELGA